MVIATKEEDILRNYMIALGRITSCSHEQADTCIFGHVRNAVEEGSKVLMLQAIDTDLLVIAISVLALLQESLFQLWKASGKF